MGGSSGGSFHIIPIFIISISYYLLLYTFIFLGSMAAHQALRADPRLFKDDVDIRFSRTLNSCKLPQVRYATPERLLQRLTGAIHL